MKLRGRVVRQPLAAGSKSERLAVVLETDDGRALVLYRRGGNPFRDPVLENLVGQEIAGEGDLHLYTFLLDTWKVIGPCSNA
jgi:hypothetical protein